jgi:hypothetical protein
MAGDWIKVEHATLNKPEVYTIAEYLGVPADQALGILLRFWVWLDANSRNGSVTHMSRSCVDAIVHTPGFAALLERVGWAKFDDEGSEMHIGNFDRHNGTPAKTRAQGQKRASRSRNADSVTESALEKRREEKSNTTTTTVGAKRSDHARSLASPTDEHRLLAKERGVDCDVEFCAYKDWLAANGRSHKDEVAGFRNWLRRAAPNGRKAGTLAEKRASTMDILTGRARNDRTTAVEGIGAFVPALGSHVWKPDGGDVGDG